MPLQTGVRETPKEPQTTKGAPMNILKFVEAGRFLFFHFSSTATKFHVINLHERVVCDQL